MSDTVILVNPRAGSGRAAAVWERARAAVPAAAAARLVLAGDPETAARQLDDALAEGNTPRRLIAVGGDGTVHLAANRLVADGLTDRVALGMVAAGTGSDLAKTLGLPMAPGPALDHALHADPRPMDLLRVTVEGTKAGEGADGTAAAPSRVVLNVASAGISGGVARRINAMPVRRPTVYLTEALRAVVRYRAFHGRVTVDGEVFHDDGIYLLAVANGPSFGKGMKVAPEAKVDDGLADVVVVKSLPAWRVPLELPRLYLGNLLASSKVIWCRGRRVRLDPAGEAPSSGAVPPLEIDGETLPGAATDFEILPGALLFLR